MKASELAKQLLEKPDDEVNIYLLGDREKAHGIAMETEYNLLSIKVVRHEGWPGLTTLETDEVMGC